MISFKEFIKLKEDEVSGTTSADIATVDNKIDIVSRSLHKKLQGKKVDNGMLPVKNEENSDEDHNI